MEKVRVDYLCNKVNQVIKSWGWNQAEYRFLLEELVARVLFIACAFVIENFIYEIENDAESHEKGRVRRYCAFVRQQREQVVAMGLQGIFDEKSPFIFQGFDAAKYDHEENLRIYLNKVYKQTPGEPDPNVIVIPRGVMMYIQNSPFLSHKDKDVLKLLALKSELAQCRKTNPRRFWPKEEHVS